MHTLVHDFNKDGEDEIVVCEFGNLTGRLSLFNKTNNVFQKKILLNRPGAIRTIAKDMNNDGKDDLIILTAQGTEGISILFQQSNLQFKEQKVLQFSPVYGASWFDLLDYDGDGDLDIVTVNGDNADKSYVHKWYHGLRIFSNDGSNNFKQEYFYSMNGATRFIANDFDQDGDVDFAIISTFPNYNENTRSFVYLENKKSASFEFKSFTFNDSKLGRWFLMDSGDFDQDGDVDIVLSSFSYVFTPVPKTTQNTWKNSKTDLIILENNLKDAPLAF